jgi:hypothetical protein
MVEQQPSKLNTRVRFPSPAPIFSNSVDFFDLARAPAVGVVPERLRATGARNAIEAFMTFESWSILMRRLLPLLALLFATPALADTLDCAVIKSTAHPFEITFDWTMTQKGKEPLTVQMRRQVTRKADETIVYEYFSPAKFTRRTLNPAGFRMQVRSAGEAATASRVSN